MIPIRLIHDSGRMVGNPSLIWCDPFNHCECVGLLLLFEERAGSSRGRFERRLISVIFAGRNRIILIRRELPLTYVASPAEPVAKGRRGFSFVPAPAAADPVLELSSVVHSLDRFSSCRHLQLAGGFRFDPDGPDETQQFAPYRGDDLLLVLACRHQLQVALVQPDLRLPGDLFDLFRDPFLALPQPGSDGWPEAIAPGRFDDDFVSDVRCRSW